MLSSLITAERPSVEHVLPDLVWNLKRSTSFRELKYTKSSSRDWKRSIRLQITPPGNSRRFLGRCRLQVNRRPFSRLTWSHIQLINIAVNAVRLSLRRYP